MRYTNTTNQVCKRALLLKAAVYPRNIEKEGTLVSSICPTNKDQLEKNVFPRSPYQNA